MEFKFLCIHSKSFFLDQERINPKEQTVPEGGVAQITCFSSGEVYWYSKDFKLYDAGEKIFFRNIKKKQSGYYICKGTTNSGHEFRARSLLNVRGKIVYYKKKNLVK